MSVHCGVLIKQDGCYIWSKNFPCRAALFSSKSFVLCQETFRDEAVPKKTTVHPLIRKFARLAVCVMWNTTVALRTIATTRWKKYGRGEASFNIYFNGWYCIVFYTYYKFRLHFKMNALYISLPPPPFIPCYFSDFTFLVCLMGNVQGRPSYDHFTMWISIYLHI